jgi:hypothetical protein
LKAKTCYLKQSWISPEGVGLTDRGNMDFWLQPHARRVDPVEINGLRTGLPKGVSVHRWIADLRLAETRRLLSERDLPIHEIAQRAAFRSASSFTSAFRAASGFTPGEFRRVASDRSEGR